MARLVPRELGTAALTAGKAAERETVGELADSLLDAFTIFYGVYWADESGCTTPIGELDFVVVNRRGAVLLVERKAGEINQTKNGLPKLYFDKGKPVADQIHRALKRIKSKWSKSQPGAGPIGVRYLLYLPDHVVADVSAGRPGGRAHRPRRKRGRPRRAHHAPPRRSRRYCEGGRWISYPYSLSIC